MRRIVTILVAVVLALAVVTPVSAGGPVFKGVTSTVDGYATWDSDMINVEAVDQTGKGVYVAVLDTGLVPNWKDYFPEERIATKLGKGFEQSVTFKARTDDPCGLEVEVGKLRETTWVGSTGSTHGTHVASTILGYYYRSNSDAAAGYPLPPIVVRGIAPEVTIIPVKVLADYQVPAMPHCNGGVAAEHAVFGTDAMVAAGINYATDLAIAGYRPMVINMSLGGPVLAEVEQDAIDRAIANGVIVVASAGNEGDAGMGFPGAYAPVISVGASGWTGEWLAPEESSVSIPYRMWWLQSDLLPYTDIPESTPLDQIYVTDWSSRELAGQQLDVLAPGSWVRGPYPGFPGYSHLPWWSRGIGDLVGMNPGNFYYLGGTSMASPHVAAVAALMLEENPAMTQEEIESSLKSTALPITPGGASVYDISPAPGWYAYDWGSNATGAGLVQVDAAIAAVTP